MIKQIRHFDWMSEECVSPAGLILFGEKRVIPSGIKYKHVHTQTHTHTHMNATAGRQ